MREWIDTLIKLAELLPKCLSFLKSLHLKFPSHALFARIFVPSLTAILSMAIYFGWGVFGGPSDQVSLIPIRSSLDQGTISAREGFLLMIDPSEEAAGTDLIAGWKNSPAPIWSSIDGGILKLGLSRVRVGPTTLEFPLNMPGSDGPFIVGVDVALDSHLMIGGQVVPASELHPRRNASASLPLVVMLTAAFCVGLTMRL